MSVRGMDNINIPPQQRTSRRNQRQRRLTSSGVRMAMSVVVSACRNKGKAKSKGDDLDAEEHGSRRKRRMIEIGRLFLALRN